MKFHTAVSFGRRVGNKLGGKYIKTSVLWVMAHVLHYVTCSNFLIICCIVFLPHSHFFCLQFQLPMLNQSPKILSGKFRNKQFISFKLSDILSSMVKFCFIPHHSAQEVNYPLAQHLHTVDTPHPIVTT